MANIIKRGSLFVVCLLLAFSSVAFAVPVTDTIAEKVGATFLTAQDSAERSMFEKRSAQGEAVEPYVDHAISSVSELRYEGTGELLAYVFALNPKGFVVVSPDTDLTPIIAYSFNGNFSWEDSNQNVLLHMLTYDMRSRVEAIPFIPEEFKEQNYDLWVKYFVEDGDFLKDLTESATYGPLVTTAWYQSSPYNDYCPMDPVTFTRSIVGCVATAMAQIVNYHACTTAVTFTSADNYTTATRGISINASTASMSSITYPASTDTAARLSYACGVAVQMDYTGGSSGSSAYTAYVANALTSKFGFTSATYVSYTGSSFFTTLQDNITHGQPAQLSIRGLQGTTDVGHSIVCDGYNSTGSLYHLNMGWGNSETAWYTLPPSWSTTNPAVSWNTLSGGVLDIKSTSHPSCPNLYFWNGEEYEYHGFIFTRTYSPESEFLQTVFFYGPIRPQGDVLAFMIKEVDKEESYVNSFTMFYKDAWDPSASWFSLPLLSAVNKEGNVMEALLEKDDRRVHMLPGDEILLQYALPAVRPGDIEFASVSSGYYLYSHKRECEVLALGRELHVEPGDTVTLRALINNMSTKALPDNSVVRFALEDGLGTSVAAVSAAGLAPGSPQWYSFDWLVPDDFTAGTYTYEASIWIGDSDITSKPEDYPSASDQRSMGRAKASKCN